jgi:hypothetical protein
MPKVDQEAGPADAFDLDHLQGRDGSRLASAGTRPLPEPPERTWGLLTNLTGPRLPTGGPGRPEPGLPGQRSRWCNEEGAPE